MIDAAFIRKIVLPLRRLLRPFELLLIVVGSVTLLFAFIQSVAVSRQLQLMVSVDDMIVYPSEITHDFSLPLSFGNKPAYEVWMAEIEILNAGSGFIGEQDALWRLFVSSDNSQIIEALEDEPDVVPSSTVHTKFIKLKPNTIAVDLGVFESKGRITLNVIVINPEGDFPHFNVYPGLPGVAKPVPGASLWGQFAERVLPIFAVSGLVVAALSFVRSFRKLKSSHEESGMLWPKIFGSVLLHSIGCIIGIFVASVIFGLMASGIFLAPSWFESTVAWIR